MDYILLIGLVAACLTTFSFLPQIIKIIKTKTTDDLSLKMYIILSIGFFLWLVYGILSKEIPIIFANLLSFSFGIIILFFIVKYSYK
ncbi:MAG: SemiSWEET transporter [Nanoarchaeota archaeon]